VRDVEAGNSTDEVVNRDMTEGERAIGESELIESMRRSKQLKLECRSRRGQGSQDRLNGFATRNCRIGRASRWRRGRKGRRSRRQFAISREGCGVRMRR